MRRTKRVLIFAASAALSLMMLVDGTATASDSCPSGSSYVKGKCYDNETGELVKVLR